ncbi:sodium/proton antiporter NhaB (plasmid) [Vibrio sp. SS-MA-C1-2]|uniref:sodium/proton antiporter NhaB n=1 Tax=Vibrio sp. SS-MA-C1-2 TaxID=2908646 RepID=UPI001F35C231|nr:sodium/proton antiporter NhaB [Vibrio sp. SS-MA-C1-2]UJF20294.1 sodium/proton antiporter NhaB [Vibrio sp. SS-MA-C1-2]
MFILVIKALFKNFLGKAPTYYKIAIISFLIINPVVYFFISPFIAGWLLVCEFIFTLAMALKCYPLISGGLLAIEAVSIGMTSAEHVKHEIINNIDVILLLIFMVAGIYFIKSLLMFIFTKLIINIRSKIYLSLAFCFFSAFLSAFLDALTVIAVIISVAVGFYYVYHKAATKNEFLNKNIIQSEEINTLNRQSFDDYRAFLRSLMMHASIGTALGGVTTMVGEPQNLIIAKQVNWQFAEFTLHMLPVTLPILMFGLLTCFLVEKYKLFGYGVELPEYIHTLLVEYDKEESLQRSLQDKIKLITQALIGCWLIIALALHLATAGLIGLTVIILVTTMTGITEEHVLGKAFEEALPFTALLTVFFAIVSVIIHLELFKPIIHWVLLMEGQKQLSMIYIANGLLSMVSDNVFVGTIYINEIKSALQNHIISREQFDLLAVAINVGTNIPSIATPNGQAAFLFMLTSAIAPLIKLSYGRMIYMALPYTIVLSLVGLVAIQFLSISTDLLSCIGLL